MEASEQLRTDPREGLDVAREHRAPSSDRYHPTAAIIDGVESTAERSWERDRLTKALEGVSEEQRQVLMLAYFHGLTHVEIAQTLDQPLGTVKTRIRLAVHKLRDALKDELRSED